MSFVTSNHMYYFCLRRIDATANFNQVCTFDCNLMMFKSRNDWFAHELQHHRREYTCQMCQKVYNKKSSFSSHLTTAHQIGLEGIELEALVLQNKEPIDKVAASACLLCVDWRSSLEDRKRDAKRLLLNNGQHVEPYGTLNQFRRHLGRHMEQLALFALPRVEMITWKMTVLGRMRAIQRILSG